MKTKTTAVAVMAWLVATMAVSAYDVGDTVERKIDIFHIVPVTPEIPTAIMAVELDAGTWDVSASLNCLYTGQNGITVFAAGALSRYVPTITAGDGETAFVGATIWNGRADPIVPSVERPIQITTPPGTTKLVILMLWVHKNHSSDIVTGAWTYGFIHARKSRLPR